MSRPFFRRGKTAVLLCLSCLSLLTACQSPTSPAMTQQESQPESSSSSIEVIPEQTEESESQPAADNSSSITPSDNSSTLPSSIQQAESSSEPDSYIMDMETIYQTPELPTGCEITALTMAMQYLGFDVSKTEMAGDYLPKSSNWYYVGDKRYGPDFRKVFAGNPFSASGYVCGAPAIETAANGYLEDIGSSWQAFDITGTSPEDLYSLILQDIPVVVWITIDMVDRPIAGGWYVEETGEYLEWSKMDHCGVLMGVDDSSVTINDPISGIITASKSRFESVYEQRGQQAVVLLEDGSSLPNS